MARYFKDVEFRRCSPSCGIADMDAEFLDLLDRVREKAGIPLVLNSAYRSPAWERAKGRSGTGAHTLGVAVDVRCSTGANRYRIIKAALACGIKRIGVGKNYIHLDVSTRHTQEVIWHYYDE